MFLDWKNTAKLCMLSNASYGLKADSTKSPRTCVTKTEKPDYEASAQQGQKEGRPTEWERVRVNGLPSKELLSDIHKELIKLNIYIYKKYQFKNGERI